jgi:hypothetical protein
LEWVGLVVEESGQALLLWLAATWQAGRQLLLLQIFASCMFCTNPEHEQQLEQSLQAVD